MWEMVVMGIFKSELSDILLVAFVDGGIISPVIDFFMMTATESESWEEAKSPEIEGFSYHMGFVIYIK